MTIITKPLTWAHALSPFTRPVKYLVLHHEAGNGTLESIHAHHKANGWAGIGYHLFVTKDGKIYAGRPMNRTGAHCLNYNGISIGICFQGNFEQDRMGETQLRAGEEAVRYALGVYPNMKLVGHKELVATACPGHYFPLEHFKSVALAPSVGEGGTNNAAAAQIKEDESMTGEEIYQRLNDYLKDLPAPDWAAQELAEAKEYGITDGTSPMALIPRYQAAIMAKRAVDMAVMGKR